MRAVVIDAPDNLTLTYYLLTPDCVRYFGVRDSRASRQCQTPSKRLFAATSASRRRVSRLARKSAASIQHGATRLMLVARKRSRTTYCVTDSYVGRTMKTASTLKPNVNSLASPRPASTSRSSTVLTPRWRHIATPPNSWNVLKLSDEAHRAASRLITLRARGLHILQRHTH